MPWVEADLKSLSTVGLRCPEANRRLSVCLVCETDRRLAVRERAISAFSAYSEGLKEGKERVGRPVTTGTGIYRSGPGKCLFLEGEVRMKIDLRGFHLLMTQP